MPLHPGACLVAYRALLVCACFLSVVVFACVCLCVYPCLGGVHVCCASVYACICVLVWMVREPGLGCSAAPRPGAWGGGSKLPQPQPRKNSCDSNETMSHVSEITLKRTDTTLDLSQQAEKGCLFLFTSMRVVGGSATTHSIALGGVCCCSEQSRPAAD